MVETSALRARFASALSAMYGREVPAYRTMLDVAGEVNEAVVAHRADAHRLGGIDRVTVERHGAIRVGTPTELCQVATIFAGFGMHPVGFYDLRDESDSAVPVVSTAFRPVEARELGRNPFRVFTSMLTVDDRRFFTAELQQRLEKFLGHRTLFRLELLAAAERAITSGGLPEPEASEFVELAAAAFALSSEPVDRQWYTELERISAVAADIGGVTKTHINHLTPRVLDIDELYGRMKGRGLEMIDEIQGPPRWKGPDVLLRQTSFRALAEPRRFREPDGAVVDGRLSVRFGEVEARGIALTPTGRTRYDELMGRTDAVTQDGTSRQDAGERVWERSTFPTTEAGLERQGLAYFTYRVSDSFRPDALMSSSSLAELLRDEIVIADPIVYEDFLPRSAAGIFQSNLTDSGLKDNSTAGTKYDIDWLSDAIGQSISVPEELYRAQSEASLQAAVDQLGIIGDVPITNYSL